MYSSPTPALFAACVDGKFMDFHGLETILWPLQEYMSLPHPPFLPNMGKSGHEEGQG